MSESISSCELPSATAKATAGSRVLRFQEGFRWEGVEAREYKSPADHWCGVTRLALIGESGEWTAFQMRYFEIAPGGFSSLEHHQHEHAVFVLRGNGEVQLGEHVHPIAFGDVVYVAPSEVHQFRNMSSDERLGFLCVVDTNRDRPVSATRSEPEGKAK